MELIRLLSTSSLLLCLSYIFRFSLTITIAKLLSTEEVGVYSWCLTAFGIFSIFINFGQDNFVLRKLPEYKQDNPSLIPKVLGFSLKQILINCSILLLIIFLLVSFNLDQEGVYRYSSGLFIISLALPVCAVVILNSSILRTNNQPIKAQIPDSILQPGLLLTLILVSNFLFPNNMLTAEKILSMNVLAWVFAFGFSILSIKRYYLENFPSFIHSSESKAWRKDSLTIVFGVLAWSLLGRSDVLFLALLVDPSDVGKYFICMRLAEVSIFFSTVTFFIWSGKISNLYQQKKLKEVQDLITKSSRLCITFTLAFFFVAILLSENILLFIGEEYSGSLFIFRCALFGFLILGSAGILGPLFYIVGDIKFYTKVQWIVGIIFLSLIFTTVPFYGVEACSIAFIACQFIYVATLMVRLKSKFNLTMSPL